MRAQRYRVFGLVVIGALVLLFAGTVRPQATGADGVQIVNGADGVGMAQSIPVGVFQVDGKQLGKSVSVKVSKEYFVQFCSQKDGTGTCEAFGEGTHNLASSDFAFIRVGKGAIPGATGGPSSSVTAVVAPVSPVDSGSVAPVTVFEQKNWGGRSQIFKPGMYRSFRGEFGKINDNQAMSVIVAKGFRARFCSEEGLNFRGSGDCEIQEEGRHNLRFANSISFIEVTDLTDNSIGDEKMPVVLYEDSSQNGKMQGFDVGTYLASQGQFLKLGNDQALSIQVKDSYKALVCSDERPAGGADRTNCEEFSAGRKNLKNKKSASYLKVWKQ